MERERLPAAREGVCVARGAYRVERGPRVLEAGPPDPFQAAPPGRGVGKEGVASVRALAPNDRVLERLVVRGARARSGRGTVQRK